MKGTLIGLKRLHARPLIIFPLASCIENAEPELRRKWRFGDVESGIHGYQPFEKAFKDTYGLKECSLEEYFDQVQIQHIPRFGYGEEIAVLSEKVSDRLSFPAAIQHSVSA